MKLTYKKRIFFCFLIIFAVFALCIVLAEQHEEKKYRTQALELRLDNTAEILHKYIERQGLTDSAFANMSHISALLPPEMRVTIISPQGKVLYDREVGQVDTLGNHLDRPEILQAQYQSHGSHIRLSTSTNHEYIYYARSFPHYFVRVALPYDIQIQNMLKPDNLFIYIVGAMFICVLLLLNYAAGRFSTSISKLKQLALYIKDDKPLPKNISFPGDELGIIGTELAVIFDQKEKGKLALEAEKDKLIRHFRFAGEGIAFFSADSKQMYSNTHFIQYLNLITDQPVLDANRIFDDPNFAPVNDFLANTKREHNHFDFRISSNGKIFFAQTVVYDDKSFEITLKDITQAEKTRQVKLEMTNNIAHELRTPVASLRGYLETLHESELLPEKQKLYIERAYIQSVRLSNLIEDVSLLSKIEEPSVKFEFENINLCQLIDEVRIDLTEKLIKNNIKLIVSVPDHLSVRGNHTLLYSVFRNLADNSIAYAGYGTEIHIDNYMEDGEYIYFSFYDTGNGVSEQHLSRLFERFYRVAEGRTRDMGGSGLGLSIVKNAIMLHHGKIEVRNRPNAGLEFLFTLRR